MSLILSILLIVLIAAIVMVFRWQEEKKKEWELELIYLTRHQNEPSSDDASYAQASYTQNTTNEQDTFKKSGISLKPVFGHMRELRYFNKRRRMAEFAMVEDEEEEISPKDEDVGMVQELLFTDAPQEVSSNLSSHEDKSFHSAFSPRYNSATVVGNHSELYLSNPDESLSVISEDEVLRSIQKRQQREALLGQLEIIDEKDVARFQKVRPSAQSLVESTTVKYPEDEVEEQYKQHIEQSRKNTRGNKVKIISEEDVRSNLMRRRARRSDILKAKRAASLDVIQQSEVLANLEHTDAPARHSNRPSLSRRKNAQATESQWEKMLNQRMSSMKHTSSQHANLHSNHQSPIPLQQVGLFGSEELKYQNLNDTYMAEQEKHNMHSLANNFGNQQNSQIVDMPNQNTANKLGGWREAYLAKKASMQSAGNNFANQQKSAIVDMSNQNSDNKQLTGWRAAYLAEKEKRNLQKSAGNNFGNQQNSSVVDVSKQNSANKPLGGWRAAYLAEQEKRNAGAQDTSYNLLEHDLPKENKKNAWAEALAQAEAAYAMQDAQDWQEAMQRNQMNQNQTIDDAFADIFAEDDEFEAQKKTLFAEEDEETEFLDNSYYNQGFWQSRNSDIVVSNSNAFRQTSQAYYHEDFETPLPTLSLLVPPQLDFNIHQSKEELNQTGVLIEEKLAEFRVKVKVIDAYAGPVITRYDIEPDVGVRGNQVINLEKDLARALGFASIRIVETIPGKTCMGLELPNPQRQVIRLSEILGTEIFTNAKSKLTLALGQDIIGNPVVTDLAKAPHLLVAGTTGSGKSVGVNAMILSILFKASPQEVRLIMIDPKMLELSIYEGIPHLLAPVVTDMKLAANALTWCVNEMEKRYRLMSHLGVRNLAGFNQRVEDSAMRGRKIANPFSLNPEDPEPLEKLPSIVVIVDEFADLMMTAGKKIEELIARLAQKARAAGIHLILATQRPSVDVITGLIKANIPTRIAFQVSSKIDSRTILDQMGAENLLGQGDMLFLPPGSGYPQRIHGAFVADEEVHNVVEYLKQFGEPNYIDDILTAGVGSDDLFSNAGGQSNDGESDPLYDEAVSFVIKSRKASISSVQRQLRIGYNRAARLIEQMQESGIVSAPENNGSRMVLVPGVAE